MVRAGREEQMLSRADLADLAGVSPRTVARIENGQTVPRVETKRRLAAVLGWGQWPRSEGSGDLDDRVFRLEDTFRRIGRALNT